MTLRRQFIGLPDCQESALQMIIDLIVLSRSKQQPQNQNREREFATWVSESQEHRPQCGVLFEWPFLEHSIRTLSKQHQRGRLDWAYNYSDIFCLIVVVSMMSKL
jgi:hypothetical protein